ncbi:MAG: transcriptional regulator [Ignavibacteria bacterium RIFOXYB2_FULL_35_12]|nr:MAG: transcriptional regulator [Ignavibacteria bacterium GWA2_36_19]OGU60773.1 MAG: transcriptional regulator [Ignavibacteria bacterium GWF2_35_20]OGU78263.1 MAG: transcriptional regulator [Ignavibacteria bacterium RIFOXYA2_FULL_35_9]OGU84188.1 MAG: transcriptional regulator [Ignavibacteria bacterium RIFOXYA12_FULL_35_25]OGU90052.1 MAG: transcriptional regulator [Ignavibacteria bacterium RIFOXYC12_FULL_35_11]OGU97338.1 MAG: transcriptional regulator [Ignavibacteria bacterium RIFOXYB12_FULL_
MSGHSKWATTKRKKAVIDAKRGKIFTKLIKEITIAAREGGGDINGNPRLRLAVDNAKAQNMPQDNIERAIKKATGELEGTTYHELNYEGYGPAGVAVIVEVATDNKNRTVAEVRHFFSKNGGTLAETGSVAWMFDRKGVIIMPKQSKSEDEIMELVLDAGADDFQSEDQYYEVQTSLENFENVRKTLIDKRLTVENASLQWIAKNSIAVKGEDAEKVIKLIESLEDNDDVQNVYTNADFDLNSLK